MSDVLVDTSVWVEHFRKADPALQQLLATDRVLTHPLVIGELACGTPPERERTLADLAELQPCLAATIDETLAMIERDHLYGKGCGIVDLMLLASTRITPGARLHTHDRRLSDLAAALGLAYRAIDG